MSLSAKSTKRFLTVFFLSLGILSGCEKEKKPAKPAPTPIPVIILSTKDPVVFREFLEAGQFIPVTAGAGTDDAGLKVCCVYWPFFNCLSYMFAEDVGRYSIAVENTTTGETQEEARTYYPGYQLLYLSGENGSLRVTITLDSGPQYVGYFNCESALQD
ncbi:MAG: hypothetical protein IJ799_05980 [Bacteroidales bacterium]|nr:hypothetical protein [Bacteroidales bacterium]